MTLRETAVFFVVLVVLGPIADVTTDWSGDRAVLAGCVVLGAVGSAWLWHQRRRDADARIGPQ